MIVISHFKLYPALFPLKWLICIPNISAVRGNVVFETLHDFYRTAIIFYCCPVKLKIAQNLSPNSFIIKDSDFFMIKASPPN